MKRSEISSWSWLWFRCTFKPLFWPYSEKPKAIRWNFVLLSLWERSLSRVNLIQQDRDIRFLSSLSIEEISVSSIVNILHALQYVWRKFSNFSISRTEYYSPYFCNNIVILVWIYLQHFDGPLFQNRPTVNNSRSWYYRMSTDHRSLQNVIKFLVENTSFVYEMQNENWNVRFD